MSEVTPYTWILENQLVGVELADESEVVYLYAPVNKSSDELRISKETDAGLIQYIWDNQNIIRELNDTGLVEAEYTLNPQPYGDLVSQSRDDESSFYLFDALGSTESLTDDTGTQTDSYIYPPFGQILSQAGTTDNQFTWVGELGYYLDEHAGLYQIRRREYDSDLGRFSSEDPLRLDEYPFCSYHYCLNSPNAFVDPSGLICVCCKKTIRDYDCWPDLYGFEHFTYEYSYTVRDPACLKDESEVDGTFCNVGHGVFRCCVLLARLPL